MFKNLPEDIKRIIIYTFLPRNDSAQLLCNENEIRLKYVRNFWFNEKNRNQIWENLRPSKLNNINYGNGDKFIIFRDKLSMKELILLSNSI